MLVDEENCFADPIVGGDWTIWMCSCGKFIRDDQLYDNQDISLSASSS